MKKHINYGKVLLVVFITILIWVWADKAQDELWEPQNVTIKADRSSSADLMITFDGKASVQLEKLTLQGPSWHISDLRSDYSSGKLNLEFFLSPADAGILEPGQVNMNILDYMRKSNLLKNLGITAVDCTPKTISIQVNRLVEKQLQVRCLRENGGLLQPKTVEPATVKMRVPADWGPDRLVAYVELSESEIEQARLAPYKKGAKVRFSSSDQRPVPSPIMIQMPPATEDLRQYTITGATVGFVQTDNLVGKYKPELLNYTELSSFTISATPDAKAAYEAQPYQILFYILDKDEQEKTEQRREVDYNFPVDFVRDGQIKLNQPKEVGRFILKPLPQDGPNGGQ
ncbi:MAG: hypothetical protein JW804_01845 [Sedimentisphaerales bacterium]|nr:hypothetical protein [Sedimentisphaerales bacterium]